MKKELYYFIVIVTLAVFCALKTKNPNKILNAEWLIGTWENKTSRGSIYETWIKTNNKEFSGKSYVLKEQDTIVFENIMLIQEENELLYIPTVKNQNNGLPVQFAEKFVSDTMLIFENPQHDFPQIISYTKIRADSLVSVISGTQNGKERKQIFPMKRIN